ncbi:MAG TPA: hypothetical protein VIR01_18290 [Pyrinomonadaceae bacterium]
MKGHLRVALLALEPPALASKSASDRLTENTTVVKILHCGKNKITESVPVHGFGLGPNKAKAKNMAIDMAHGFANAVAAARAAELQCPKDECPKMIRPQVVNEKTTELLTVILQANLYLSVVRTSFDIVIFCR